MKQLLSLISAGVIGGLIVFFGTQWSSQSPSVNLPIAQPMSMRSEAPATTVKVPFDFKEAARIATPAVVNIEAKQTAPSVKNDRRSGNPFDLFFGDFQLPKEGSGSGVIYTSDGYIITNNHVVSFANEIDVTLDDNRRFRAEVIGKYPEADIAVLKIEATGLPTLQLANSDNAEVGEWVLAVGNPFNLVSTVTAGIISARGRNINAIRGSMANAIESFIQTDAAVNPGNSGGALVDSEGRLLGINTAIATKTGTFAGYSFAIPINLAKRIADDIIENGGYQRAMLGVEVLDLTSKDPTTVKILQGYNLDPSITQGVVVDKVVDGGAAQYAGILPRDIIVGLNGKIIRNFPELQEAVSSLRVGDIVEIKIYRGGKYSTKEVKLK
jgi:S1-C subfamily serine protease